MRRCFSALFLISTLLCGACYSQATVKRGRGEGTMNIPASNVVGNGNISAVAAGFGSYGTPGIQVDPLLGASFGIANIMEIKARGSYTNFLGLGICDGHLQVTTPMNDHLRFFGVALVADLYLSTSADTLSGTTRAGKPEYNSYMRPSCIVDFDWLALYRHLPLKTYLFAGMADEPNLLFRYEQISIKAGAEMKWYQHSVFIDVAMGLYKENRYRSFSGDASYCQGVIWFEPGFRYRLLGMYSLLGSLRLTAYRNIKRHDPLPINLVRGGFALEIPLLFRESNTEAIRTMIFVDQRKEKKGDKLTKNIDRARSVESSLGNEFDSLYFKSETPDPLSEKAELKKREEIQQKMEAIEKLLEGIQ